MANLFNVPPHEPFVDALATGLLDEAGSDPLTLADALILLPTRRACRSLRDAFLRRSQPPALILPRIQPLGEADVDELMADGLLEDELPPVIGRLRRRLLLARLLATVERQIEHRLRLADELAVLLDEIQTEGVDFAALDRVVPETLAEHWQRTRRVLGILGEAWPAVLAEEQALEPARRRNRMLDALARRLLTLRPDRRIVAAGTTGSIPATRRLLAAILELPRGAVVLPGLDVGMDDATFAALEPVHPQYGMKQLLEALGCSRTDVRPWPGVVAGPEVPVRLPLLREAMRPAATIGAAPDPRPLARAGRPGLEVAVLPDFAGEALALALRMRAVAEQPARTAALVTPDRALARRVALELRRWAIEVDDSAGVPLDQTPSGSFLLLAARLLDRVTPVALLALLKHPFARLGLDASTFRAEVRALEQACLRGPRVAGGFPGLLAALDGRLQRVDEAKRPRLLRSRRRLEQIDEIARPFLGLARSQEVELGELLEAHLRFAEALAAAPRGEAPGLWAKEGGEAAAAFCNEILEAAGSAHPIAPGAYAAMLGLLMAERPVRSAAPRHPRLAIYGQLEARLQQADLVLIGGLNEGVWPAPVDSGPWLNRAMRASLGLPPVERRIGLAAHDLQQLACAPQVVLSRAERDPQGNPTVPSRWLVRLGTLLDAAGGAGEASPWPAWAALLDAPAGPPQPTEQPRPAPPLAARPRCLSVSDIGLWMRDPYALYARRVLKLRQLDPLEADPGALERGIMIHGVLEEFCRAFPADLPPDALSRLLDLGRNAYQAYAHQPQVRALWWPRFEQAARWYLEQEQVRRPAIGGLMVEVVGKLALNAPAGPFYLTARADRLERGRDGRLTVVDHKTGRIPKTSEVKNGRAPQLPLEALMAISGAFEHVPPAVVAGLWFWSLTGDVQGGEVKELRGMAPEEFAAAARAGLTALLAHYDQPDTAYPARPRPDTGFAREYDHLARLKEWSG